VSLPRKSAVKVENAERQAAPQETMCFATSQCPVDDSCLSDRFDAKRQDSDIYNVDPQLLKKIMASTLGAAGASASQAAAYFLLRAACTKESKNIGRAVIQRMFFQSLPREYVEIVSLQDLATPSSTGDFLGRLSMRNSCDLRVMFRMPGASTCDDDSLAGRCHQCAPGETDEAGNVYMLLVLSADQAGNDPLTLISHLVKYRLTSFALSVSDVAREERFQKTLSAAIARAEALTKL
jgi:hypothetical protein